MEPSALSIADLIEASGKTMHKIADEAAISRTTLHYCKQENRWPKQRRVREALQKSLGVTPALVEV
jgi:hypothetical protein